MMTRLSALAVVVALMGMYAMTKADEAKPVTLQGDLVCGHCVLHQGTACNDVLIVKEDGKDVNYSVVLPAKSQHQCTGKKAVKITGTLSEKDGQKVLTASKVEPVKQG